MTSFRDVIALWPSHRSMATAIGTTLGSVQKWSERDSIPPRWWAAIISSAEARRAGVNADVLTMLAAGDASSAQMLSRLAAREATNEAANKEVA
jgi:hypothetical protein